MVKYLAAVNHSNSCNVSLACFSALTSSVIVFFLFVCIVSAAGLCCWDDACDRQADAVPHRWAAGVLWGGSSLLPMSRCCHCETPGGGEHHIKMKKCLRPDCELCFFKNESQCAILQIFYIHQNKCVAWLKILFQQY